MGLGIKPKFKLTQLPKEAGIIELMTQKGQEYWLAYPNFYVITRYNSSPQYALVVYLFAQQLNNKWVAESKNKKHYAVSNVHISR